MKSNIIDYEPRLVIKPDTTAGILRYDTDNAYPQRMAITAQGSSITLSCLELYSKYIRGLGFQDTTYYSSICNRKRWTFDKILRAISRDFALHKGFALHFNFNALYEISEINYVPFEHVRIATPDSTGYISKVKLFNDWGKKSCRYVDENLVKTIDVFQPNPEIVAAQIDIAGGIEKYLGQVWYFTDDAETYPHSAIDPIQEDCETDGEVKYFKNRNVTTGFMAQYLWIDRADTENKKEEREHLDNLKSFQGSRNSSKIIRIVATREEEEPKILPFVNNINDKLFAYTEQSVQETIVRNFRIPPILLGITTPGALGEKNDREGAQNTYSDITKDERILMEAAFSIIHDHWHKPEHNNTGNFTITPIAVVSKTINVELYKDMTVNERRENLLNLSPQEEQQSATKLLADTLGVGGTQAYIALLTSLMSNEQKIENLILLFGLTREDAIKAVTPTKDAVS